MQAIDGVRAMGAANQGTSLREGAIVSINRNEMRRRTRSGICHVREAAKIELLDPRVFLSSTYDVASTGITSVFLEQNFGTSYAVDVFLNSTSGSPASTLTPDANNQVELIGHSNGLRVVDQIAAAAKPTGGIKFHMGAGGSNGDIEVDASDDDTYLTITASTSNSATIVTNDGNHQDTTTGDSGIDLIGAGVNHINLKTNDLHGSDVVGSKVEIPTLAGGLYLRVDTGDATNDTVIIGENSSVG